MIEIRGGARSFCLKGKFVLLICYPYRLSYTYTNTYIYTHTHTQNLVSFIVKSLKINFFVGLNSPFTSFYSEIIKIFVFNIYKLPNSLPLRVKKFSIELMKCSDINDSREHILQQKINLRNNTFSITILTNWTIFLKKII